MVSLVALKLLKRAIKGYKMGRVSARLISNSRWRGSTGERLRAALVGRKGRSKLSSQGVEADLLFGSN